MVKAIWNNATIAESNDTVIVETNHHFPLAAVDQSLLRPRTTTSTCRWKGTANYYSLEVDGQTNKGAVWYYAVPFDAAAQIKDRVAFWKGVKVS